MKSALSDQSTVTIGLAIALCGVVWRVAHLDSRVDEHTDDIARIEARQIAYVEGVQGMKTDLEVIKVEIKSMHVSMKKKDQKEVALRAGAPKFQCSLFNKDPFSMNESGI